jgi:chemosensory pili system protein ChpA (sensor histidine kinase/response regulator)
LITIVIKFFMTRGWIIVINSERLCHLQTEVADKAYQLYEAVAILADEATAEDDLPETIEQIIIYVQEVADGADAIELTGLKRVCELTQESLFELAIEDQVKRLELCQVVEQWPRLVVHYLQAMDNADCSHQFLNYLQNQCWQRPLAEDEAVVLIAELTGQQSITDPFEVQAVETISKIAQSTEIIEELAEVDLEEIAELDKSISELEITESTEIPEELTAIPLEEIAELDESISESEFTESTEISEELTEIPLEEISELDESVSESEFTESTEISEELTENSSELNEVVSAEPSETTSALPSNAELDKMLDEATFDIANEEEELESVEHQEEDIFSEDESSGNTDLSKNDSESQDLSEIEEDMIFSDDALADSESELMIAEDELQLKEGEKENIIFEDSVNFQRITESQKEEIVAEAPVTLEPSKILLELSEKIAEIEAILADTFRKFVALEEENEIFLESVEKYTNTLQLLWEFFAERNLSGLQEVCTFINDNFFELSSQSQSERQSLRARFLLWPQLVLDYLHAPDQKSTTLVEFLQDNQWPLPLLKKQTNNLLVQLVQDAVVLQTKSGQSKFESMTELRAESLAKPQQVTIAESVAKREKAVAQQATATQEKSSKAAKKDEKVFSFDLAASSSTKTEMPLKSDWESAFVDEDVLLASESKENDLLLFSEEFENSQAKNKLPTEKPIDLEYSENLEN